MVYAILNSRIPETGRRLTSAETKELRAVRGYAPTRAYVVQAGADYRGYVYRSVAGGMTETGIVVETK